MPITLANDDWSWLRHKRSLVLGVAQPDYPPFEMTAGAPYYEGITADVACYLGQTLHVGIEIQRFTDRRTALSALEKGEIDLLGSANGFEVAGGNTVLSKPYVEDHPALFVRSQEQQKLPANLAGVRIAMADDYLPHSQLKALFPHARFLPYPSRELALAALAFGDVDGYLGDGLSSNYLINLSYFNYVRLERFVDLHSGGFSFAIRRGNEQLKSILDRAIGAIDESHLSEITKRWSGGGAMLSTRTIALSTNEQRWIERHPKVRYVVNDDLAPFAFFDSDEHFSGMSSELLELIRGRTGLQFEAMRTDSFANLISSLFDGDADLTIAAPTAEREADLRFSRPFIFSSFVIVARDIPQAPRSLDALRGKRVAVPLMAAERDVLTAYTDIEVIDSPTILESLSMVADGRADATFATLHGARYYLQHLYASKLRITNILEGGHGALAFAARRADTELISIIDKALQSISPDEIDVVLSRWRPLATFEGMSWRNYKTLIYQIGAAAFVFIFCSLIWNLYIRRQIRERRRAELALADQLKFMEALINGTPHPIYVRDRQGRLVTCNNNYLKTFAVSSEDVIGKTALESGKHNREEALQFHDGYLRVMEQDEPYEVDRTLHVDATQLSIYHWIQPFHDTSGQVQGVICGWIDISERRELIEDLRAAKQRADDSNRAKTTFLATMSHEIRTPMSAVIGMLELALNRVEQGHFDRSAIEVAYDSAKGMLVLIGDILDVVRIESGHLSLSPKRANLRELVESVARAFEGLARQKNLIMKLDINASVGCDVLVDPKCFQQIFSNLLGNAIKFTDVGEVRVSISGQRIIDERLQVDLSVEDTGIGIHADDLQRLFQPFSQADHGSSSRGGTGLGLAISRSLCELMGGSLQISSTPGVGTRLEVSLLFNTLDAVAIKAPPRAVPQLRAARTLQVLVADDQRANRLLLVQQLSFLGQSASAAEDGAVALELWRSGYFDIVITDCNMPVMNGYALVQQIRRDEIEKGVNACFVVGLTANAQPEEKAKCLQAGMDNCLFKPMSLSTLSDLLSNRQESLTCIDNPAHEAESFAVRLSIPERLGELTGGDTEVTNLLIQEALLSGEKDLAELKVLLATNETFAFADLAHRIKGAARIVADQAVIDCCEALEQASNASVIIPAYVVQCARSLEEAQMASVNTLRNISTGY
ncbi:transporter substrate-binding domain-containing protein [Pseudomonas sp. LB3P14]